MNVRKKDVLIARWANPAIINPIEGTDALRGEYFKDLAKMRDQEGCASCDVGKLIGKYRERLEKLIQLGSGRGEREVARGAAKNETGKEESKAMDEVVQWPGVVPDDAEQPDEVTAPPSVIVVTGLPRCGTSMMMHCLHLAGVPLAFTSREERPRGREVFRNPAGFYEGRWTGKSGLVKVIGREGVMLPHSRIVMMVRDVAGMKASWEEVRRRRRETVTERNPPIRRAGRIDMAQRAVMLQRAVNHSGRPFIVVDYDQFVTDPESYREDFSGLFPELDFERIKAGVDSSLYVRR